MTPKNNKDLSKLFGVESIITPRSVCDETDAEIGNKTPAQITDDIKTLMDEVSTLVHTGDIEGVRKRLEAAKNRTEVLIDIVDIILKGLQ